MAFCYFYSYIYIFWALSGVFWGLSYVESGFLFYPPWYSVYFFKLSIELVDSSGKSFGTELLYEGIILLLPLYFCSLHPLGLHIFPSVKRLLRGAVMAGTIGRIQIPALYSVMHTMAKSTECCTEQGFEETRHTIYRPCDRWQATSPWYPAFIRHFIWPCISLYLRKLSVKVRIIAIFNLHWRTFWVSSMFTKMIWVSMRGRGVSMQCSQLPVSFTAAWKVYNAAPLLFSHSRMKYSSECDILSGWNFSALSQWPPLWCRLQHCQLEAKTW